MKKTTKALLLVVCAMLLVAASVLGTLAFLTAQDTVTNTFTVGKVALTLDEAKVDEYGVPVENAERVDNNTYKLIPGKKYTKDPIVHVDAASENCWVFIKVDNAIAAYEAAGTTIADQIVANGWTVLETGVYYQEYKKGQNDAELEVFAEFVVAANAEDVEGWNAISTSATKVTVTAYAIQQEGFDNAGDAWAELNKVNNP